MTDTKQRTDLEEDLQRYCQAAGITRKVHKGAGLAKWALYTAAAGSALGAPAGVEAGVIYSDVQNIAVTPGQGGAGFAKSADVDLNGDSVDDFRLMLKGNVAIGFATAQLLTLTNPASAMVAPAGVLRLSASATVSQNAGGAWGSGRLRRRLHTGGIQGYWPGGYPAASSGFAGVAFQGTGGDTHYGWLRLAVRNDWRGAPNQLTLVDWAYESENLAPIHVGSVPEPNSLALLAAGSAGVAAFRKRRQTKD